MKIISSKTSFDKLSSYLDYLKEQECVIAVILFGSYAKKTQKETSDIDICIMTTKNTLLHELEILGRDEGYDIHLFNNLCDVLKFKIFKEGKILFIKNPKEYSNIRRIFLHNYRAMYSLRLRNKQRILNAI